MEIVEEVQEIQAVCRRLRREGREIGLVPTMGAFHEGHLSLIRESRRRDEVVVVSLFVNPIQFGPSEDYQEYPRDREGDFQKATSLGVDYLFVPSAEAIYPKGFRTYVLVEGLSEKLCGAVRPGHFRGVTTVVAKLFHLITPHRAYFGQKDAQQAILIGRMIADLNWDIELVVLPTVREADGLAMSSRNAYLSEKEREEATILYRSLCWAEEEIRRGERDAERIREGIRRRIASMPAARMEYVSVVDAESLEEVKRLKGKVLIALAARFGRARLIDNCLIAI
ncbi:MAG: pantoate--beta-alanine ligase [candidate division NC10 bacterium]|nr:pantoate--beta-alanine ligase [candidate division NC10 bacterium]